jgi:anti-anti-sigma factor
MDEVRRRSLAVTVVGGPLTRSARIRLVGDVDMSGKPALIDAVRRLAGSAPDVVVVDMTAVTFVCSTFANFVAEVHDAVPDAALILQGPSPMARRVLAITGLDELVTMPDDVGSITRP